MLDKQKAAFRTRATRRESIEMNKQSGGTMLGLMIGAAVGLAVALLVAVYVSKVPVPFTDARTAAVNGAERDASEAKKNKDWDPNGALASKGRVPPPPPQPRRPTWVACATPPRCRRWRRRRWSATATRTAAALAAAPR